MICFELYMQRILKHLIFFPNLWTILQIYLNLQVVFNCEVIVWIK